MGSRHKREQIQKGLRWRDGHWVPAAEVEKAEGEKMLRCWVCGGDCPARLALDHVKVCWGITYPSMGMIPRYPPPQAYRYYQEHHLIVISEDKHDAQPRAGRQGKGI